MNIRGAAGPYIVHAKNFAPGTTAADIESVMQNVGGAMIYCKLVATGPVVIAEMSFVDRSGAEKVIDMFHNKKVCKSLRFQLCALLTGLTGRWSSPRSTLHWQPTAGSLQRQTKARP